MTDSGGRQGSKGGGDPHGWNSEQEYFNAHDHCMEEQRAYFVEHDTLERIELPGDLIQLKGRIDCKFGLFLDVDKTLERNSRGQVRTISYSYQACLAGQPTREIFRYDDAHPHKDHQDKHHKHVFNTNTWREIEPPQWVGQSGWPHLSDVLNELHDWWLKTGQYLDLSTAPEVEDQ